MHVILARDCGGQQAYNGMFIHSSCQLPGMFEKSVTTNSDIIGEGGERDGGRLLP